MRLRKDITRLLLHVEKPVIGVLQAHNLITRKSKTLATADLTPEAKVLIGDDDELVTDEWIKKWRALWPTSQKGDLAIIRKKLNRFLQEEEVELNSIFAATEAYITSQSEPKYAGNANYFFYKKTNEGDMLSRCREWIEAEDSPPQQLYGDELF